MAIPKALDCHNEAVSEHPDFSEQPSPHFNLSGCQFFSSPANVVTRSIHRSAGAAVST
jgi:hypothetical protein